MATPNTAPDGYSATQIALHWAVAVLVAALYILKDSISGAWEAIRAAETFAFEPLILTHVGGGGLILALVVWRLVLRIRRGVPAAQQNEPAPLRTLSHMAHWAFYAVLAAMVVTGSLAWFGDVTEAAEVHNALKVALLALIALHVLAVPFHRIVLKNNVMRRPAR